MHRTRIVLVIAAFAIAAMAQKRIRPATPPADAMPAKARIVKYFPNDIVPIRAKLRYTTMIVLPPDEKILDFVTGDKDYWIINGIGNFCFLHPAKAGISSNLNLITDKGHVYSFTLQEVSDVPHAEPDLKVIIQPSGENSIVSVSQNAGLAPMSEVNAYKAEAQEARTQAEKDEEQFRSQYAIQIRFDYDFPRNKRPFDVDAIWQDGKFTYIRSSAAEKPALYERKDGKPSLVGFQLENGVYIAAHVIDDGYLQIGSKKMNFHIELPPSNASGPQE